VNREEKMIRVEAPRSTAVAQPQLPSMPADRDAPTISVIVPVTERAEPLAELYREYSEPLRALGEDFEFVYVAHPFFGAHLSELRELKEAGEPVSVIESARSVGETALLRMALAATRGEIIITLPAYRQVGPEALPALLERVTGGADLAVARRWPRKDALINRVQHRVLHSLIGGLGGHRIHDAACGVRAARRSMLEEMPLYGDFVRFLPLLAMYNGYEVEEVSTPQHERDKAGRVYGPGVYMRRLLDVLGLFFLLRFTDKPLRFFGLVGGISAVAGALLLLILLAERIAGEGIGGRPMLLLAVLMTVLGVQAIALGLIGEMIVHFNVSGKRRYRVKDD
jgi:hypothetical protein